MHKGFASVDAKRALILYERRARLNARRDPDGVE